MRICWGARLGQNKRNGAKERGGTTVWPLNFFFFFYCLVPNSNLPPFPPPPLAQEICRFSLDWLAKVENDTAVILAKITRKDHQWEFCTIGKTAVGRTIEELEGRLAHYL